jgi:hypothetical protein
MPICITDDILKNLYSERTAIQRKTYTYEITNQEADKLIDEINDKIKIRMSEIIQDLRDKNIISREKTEQEIKSLMEDETMSDEQKAAKKEKGSKDVKPRGKRADSYAAYIIEALQKKTIKNIDNVVAYVVEKKPGREAKSIKIQAIQMINEIKKGKKPAYTWDEANFLLVPKA